MFFILSKVLLFSIQPICWIFYLLLITVFTKNLKRKKRLFFTAFVLFYFFSNTFIFNQFSRVWDISDQPLNSGVYSCAIVLGGFTSVDKNGKGYFNEAANRYIAGVNLIETGKAAKLLISGGSGLLTQGSQFKEADFTVAQLKLLKIPDSNILIENQSRNTLENAVFSKKILAEKKIIGPYILVTSSFHMRRALYTFKKAGLDVVPHACDLSADKKFFSPADLIIPDPVALAGWNTYIKELIGYVTYHFKSF